MNVKRPTSSDLHAATVTRTALKGGGACYHVTVSAASEAIIQNGCGIEGMTAPVWIASSINLRLRCLAQALINIAVADENRPPETVN